MTTTSKELTLPERAAVALKTKAHEIRLHELVTASVNIVAVKNKDGREECHAAYMRLKNARCEISNLATDATEDAKKFTKVVRAEEKRLIEITTKEEDRLKLLRDDWDAAEQVRKDALIAAERERIESIQSVIAKIQSIPFDVVGMNAAFLRDEIAALEDTFIDESFEEFVGQAQSVHAAALKKLNEMLICEVEKEVEALRIQQERIDAAAKLKEGQEALAKQQAEHQKKVDELEVEAKKVRDAHKVLDDQHAATIAANTPTHSYSSGPIETIEQLDTFIAAKNERLGIVETVQISISTEPNMLTKHTQDQLEADFYHGADYNTTAGLPLTAPEYRPSAKDIVHALEQLYEEPRKVIIKWLIESNFSEVKE